MKTKTEVSASIILVIHLSDFSIGLFNILCAGLYNFVITAKLVVGIFYISNEGTHRLAL